MRQLPRRAAALVALLVATLAGSTLFGPAALADTPAPTAPPTTAEIATEAAEAELLAAPARPFGSHPEPFPVGAARAPGGTAAADQATAAAYDAWKAAYLKAGCGTGRYYVDASSATNSLVVSEGQGYGMVVTALMAGYDPNARTAFDGLYRYVQDHPSASDPDLMAWHQDTACTNYPNDNSSATDGDFDIAYALLLADTQWGSGGAIDYRTEALTMIAAIKRSEINPQTLLPRLGDWTSPGTTYWFATRTSDLMVDHFVAFQNATGDEFWGQVTRATTQLVTTLQEQFAPETGLLPDFVVDTETAPKPAPPDFLESPDDGAYGYNAARTPWRLASSALLTGDAASRTAVARMTDWIVAETSGVPSAIRAGYELDGTPLANYTDLVFTAPFGAGGLPDARDQGWVDRVWTRLTSAGTGQYFGDSIRLQVMLLASGNSWLPQATAAPSIARITGADRYAVSAAVSAGVFAPGAPVVYIASGEVFPDALSASAAAGADSSPVLLVSKGSIPASVAAELTRLTPKRIVLMGGVNTITPAVETALRGYVSAPGTVDRIGGADRYAVSATLSAQTFAPGGQVAYVASGEVFADALSGSAAAGAQGAPVLLTQKNALPAVVKAELQRLAPARIVLLGGANTVTEATRRALESAVPGADVTRIGGADRYAVAAAVSKRVFAPIRTTTVYAASGAVFPDALSASAAAIAAHAPVLLVAKDAVPAATAAELTRLGPNAIVVPGGPNTVSDATVAALATYLVARG
ncbi:glycosyl hydrolase family 8 [Herbiconiux sp.]|uniref:glycosyl hydrolase family 8 n=1 Tax=Herbiconiux sp. TaxID=1871186 RepID=UPI0025BC2842|nr:glycosyl hydrolase family 8 [Herbiconiux sp.]